MNQQVEESPGPTTLRPFRMGLAFGFFNAMTWQVALGTPMVLLAEHLGATAFQVGLLYSFVFLLTPVQVLSTSLLPRFGFQRVMLFGWGFRSLFLVVPLTLAVISRTETEPWMLRALLVSMFLFCLLRSVGNSAFVPWLYSILPHRLRGRYFASDQIFSGIAGVGTLLLSAFLFEVFRIHTAFFWQYVVAIAGALLAWYALAKLGDGPKPRTISLRTVVREAPRLLFRKSPFRQFLRLSFLFAICSAPIPPFCAYYLRVVEGLEPGHVMWFTVMQYCGAISGAVLIRNLIDGLGAKPFFRVGMGLYMVVATTWWLFLRTDGGWVMAMLLIYFLLGMGTACWFSANLNYLPKVCTEEDRLLKVSTHGAVTAFIGGLSPIIWGIFLKGTPEEPAMNIEAFKAFFIFVFAGQILLLWRVSQLKEDDVEARPIQLGGVMSRPFRSLGYLINLVIPAEERRRERNNGDR